ncbi:MAG: hypothetical protein DYH06_08595 [Acidobacteria bacterium ACB2]|nr:hypothetical protein [Acidobacteria bacterium ACB2]
MLVAAGFLAVAAAGYAANEARKGKFTRETASVSQPSLAKKNAPKALVTIDYVDTGSTFYTWGGDNYMSNIFKPAGGSYPLDVVSLDVYYSYIDDSSTAAGSIDGVRVFDEAGTVLASQRGVAGTPRTWVNVAFASPPQIAAGNFIGGTWNSNVSSTDRNDCPIQGAVNANWTAPPVEPFRLLTGGATAGAAGPWTVVDAGAAYTTTTSAATVIANINTNVPVELMRFSAE